MKVTNKIISLFTTAAFVASCNLYGNINKVNKTAIAADKIYTADGGFSADEIAASPVKPTITLTKKVISLDEAGETQQIDVIVSGADLKYCATEISIEYDPRILINITRAGNVDATHQQELLGQADLSELNNKKSIRLITAARGNYGYDGVLWTFNITLPSDAQMGDAYLFDIYYNSSPKNLSLFYGTEASADDKLMSAYTFTQGIYNEEYNNNFKADIEDIKKCSALADIPSYVDGYIAIESCSEPITTATTTILTTTMTTTTEAITTTTTEKTTTAERITTTKKTEIQTTTTTDITTPPTTTEPAISLGDVNSDGVIDSSDASSILVEYAAMSTGGKKTLTEGQRKAADVNSDGMTDSSDASKILQYYAYCSTGGKETDMLKWLDTNK